MKFLSVYLNYIRMFIKAKSEYRMSFLLGIFVNIFDNFITYISLWVIFDNFKVIEGWNFYEMAILYGLFRVTDAFAGMFLWYTMNFIDEDIITGNLDVYLIRPMGLLQQMVCRRFGETYIGQIIVVVIFMVYSFERLNYTIHLWTWLYLVLVLISGTLIHAAALIVIGSLNFWFLGAKRLAGILYNGMGRFTQYPLTIFPGAVRIVLTYILPWALINYYPCLVILNKVQTTEERILGLAAPGVGGILFGLSVYILNKGIHRYSGNGG
ncbi:hypothetical protein IMSAGC019_03304 [Lachnospiraceae bacterium]|nr:hypothetical protein IMSAGC019_03304 [Lachnospiraceae bacterium]